MREDYSNKVSFRPAREDDYDFLYSMHVATMKDYVDKTWGWNEVLQQEYFRKGFNPSELQIITFDNKDAGKISIEDREEDIFLRTIAILPEYQSRGIGTYIIQSILDNAEKKNKSVLLQVLKVNPARKLYERLGFKTINETATHYIMRK